LSKLLEFKPERRITVEEALSHPYFKDFRDITDELKSDQEIDFSFDKNIKPEKLKRKLTI
jgi:serine/threonine protein kinase